MVAYLNQLVETVIMVHKWAEWCESNDKVRLFIPNRIERKCQVYGSFCVYAAMSLTNKYSDSILAQ